jgi:hypothetical protein
MNANTGRKLSKLSERAAAVRADPRLRHTPNEHDIRKASENARLMAAPQYRTIKVAKDDNK